jgi:hypothetical protein
VAVFQVTDEWANYLATSGGAGSPDVDGDTYKAVLSNVAPTKAGTQLIGTITQITGAGSYAPVTLTGISWAETGAGSGIWQFSSAAFAWTASGANFDTARYIAIYDDTPTVPADPVVGFLDYGTTFVVTDGSTFTVTPGANGIYRITVS